MHDFVYAFIGGAFIGLATVGYLYVHGKIAGISGMIAQVLMPQTWFKTPVFWFLLGLLAVPLLYGSMTTPQIDLSANTGFLLIAGVLVGFGTRLGSGCTSGHGICGMSRLSKRSILATLTFMAAGVLTVYVMRHVLGA